MYHDRQLLPEHHFGTEVMALRTWRVVETVRVAARCLERRRAGWLRVISNYLPGRPGENVEAACVFVCVRAWTSNLAAND